MAKREKRAQLFGKLGLASAVLTFVGVVGSAVLLRKPWTIPDHNLAKISESMIVMGPTRSMVVYLGLFLTFAFGVFGFIAGLEATASAEAKIRKYGWIAFWVGTVCAMIAIVLGLCVKAYSYSI